MSPLLLYILLQALFLSQGFNITDDQHPKNVTKLADQKAIEFSFSLSQGCSGVLRAHHMNTVNVALRGLDAQKKKDLANQICENLGCGQAYVVNGTVLSGMCFAGCILKKSKLHECTTAAEDDCTNATKIICEHQAVRLVGGHDRCVGRVELLYTGQWGTVCDDDFDLRSGHVVCAQLGCGSVIKLDTFGAGTGPIHISKMKCNGTERNLWECSVNDSTPKDYCGHKEDIGIVCSESTELTHTTSNTTYLASMTWTTESPTFVATEHRSGVSPALIGCFILSVALLLLILSNAAVCVHFKRRKERDFQQNHSIPEYQVNAPTGTYNPQIVPPASPRPYESLGFRPSSNYGRRFDRGTNRSNSSSSADSDYEHHNSDRAQQPHLNNLLEVPVDDSVQGSTLSGESYQNTNLNMGTIRKSAVSVDYSGIKCSGESYQNTNLNMDPIHKSAVDSNDSSSTSSCEFYTNTKTDMVNSLQSCDEASLQEQSSLIQLSHRGQNLPGTGGYVHVNDSDSTSSGEDYQNTEIDMDNNLQSAVNVNDSDSTSSGDYQNTEIDMDNNLQSEEKESPSCPEKSLQTPHSTQMTGNTHSQVDVNDSDSTSSEECYQNTEIQHDFLQSGEESPSLPEMPLQTPLNHHSPQMTGSAVGYEDHPVPRNLSQETDHSSTSSENSYVNVPPRSEGDDGRSPAQDDAQFSSGSDYDEPENW